MPLHCQITSPFLWHSESLIEKQTFNVNAPAIRAIMNNKGKSSFWATKATIQHFPNRTTSLTWFIPGSEMGPNCNSIFFDVGGCVFRHQISHYLFPWRIEEAIDAVVVVVVINNNIDSTFEFRAKSYLLYALRYYRTTNTFCQSYPDYQYSTSLSKWIEVSFENNDMWNAPIQEWRLHWLDRHHHHPSIPPSFALCISAIRSRSVIIHHPRYPINASKKLEWRFSPLDSGWVGTMGRPLGSEDRNIIWYVGLGSNLIFNGWSHLPAHGSSPREGSKLHWGTCT